MARLAAAFALVLAAFGFSLGYWQVLSGIGDLFWGFDASVVRVLFDLAAIGLPFAAIGFLLGVIATLHATDVPPMAIVPAMLAGYAIGWIVDPFGTLAGQRMNAVRTRYAAALVRPTVAVGKTAGDPVSQRSLFASYGGDMWGGSRSEAASSSHHETGGSGSGGGFGAGNGNDGGGDPGQGAVVLLLIALAALAIAGGVVTAVLVFQAARKKAKAQLAADQLLKSAYEIALSR